MALLVAFTLIILAFLCYRIYRSWLFPPALYSLVWATILVLTVTVRYRGFVLSNGSVLVFTIGCLSFVSGSLLIAQYFSRRALPTQVLPQRERFIRILIITYAIGLLFLVPFFITAIEEAGRRLGISQFAFAARFALGLTDRGGIPRYFLSLCSIGSVLAFCMAWLYDGSRRDKLMLALAVVAPLSMYSLTFSRSPVFALIIGVIAILAFRRAVKPFVMAIGVAATLALTLIMGASLGKGPDFTSGSNAVVAAADNLLAYYAGGPLGFDQVMYSPESVGEKGLSLRFFTQAARSLGAEIRLPSNVLDYFSGDLGNVYTIYFAYWLDWSWLGIIVIPILGGCGSTMIYVFARRGNPIAGVALAPLIGSIVNSPIGDGLFSSLIPWLLIVALTWLLWYAPLPGVPSRKVYSRRITRKLFRLR